MKEVRTVLGDMESNVMGFCQCHEHLMLKKGPAFYLNSALCMEDKEKSKNEVMLFRKNGGNTLVDAQPVGCGRMERELRDISKITGVHIVASTGFHKREFYCRQHWIFHKAEEELIRIFTEELENGMFVECDTVFSSKQMDACAGQIKIALEDKKAFDDNLYRYRAAVRTAAKTGRSIMVHTEKNSPVQEFLSLCKAYGVCGNQVAICHMDRTCEDIKDHLAVAQSGVFLEYDTIGRWKYHSDRKEIELIQQILKEGFGRQLLLSLDTTAARMKAYCEEGIGLDYLKRVFCPELERQGVSREDIDMITRENSQKYLGRK